MLNFLLVERCFVRFALAILCLSASGNLMARSMNGNDFALYYSEAKDVPGRKALLDEALGNPHFFRYLQIMEIEEVEEEGQTRFDVVAFEPASLMDVRFSVTRSQSKNKIREEPASKRGDALAVTGKVTGIDPKNRTILLGSVIVQHKDRLSPAVGKEMLCDVDPGSVFYSYTGGKRPVAVSYRDRDLLADMDRKKRALGPQGWADYLEKEVATRNRARAAKQAAGDAAP